MPSKMWGTKTGQKAPGTFHRPDSDRRRHRRDGVLVDWRGVYQRAIETGVLLFLLLATGDRFTPRLAAVLQQTGTKKDAVEMTQEIQQSISKYLFTVSVINCCLGFGVGFSLHLAGMPNALMWGVMAAVVN